MSNWYKKINAYIDSNLENFIKHFFPQSTVEVVSGDYRVNPSPCCGHNDCFSFASKMNAGNCFSCRASGNRIKILEDVIGEKNAIEELQRWSGITKGDEEELSSEELKEMSKRRELNEIYDFAAEFYNMQLFSNDKTAKAALGQQLSNDIVSGGRAHSKKTLKEFNVGLSLDNFNVLIDQLLGRGYSEEVVNEARKLIWIPPYYFVYPYYRDGQIVRFNAKAFKRVCLGSKNSDGSDNRDCAAQFLNFQKKEIEKHINETKHNVTRPSFSTGDKNGSFFGLKKQIKTKNLILVEGEDDLATVHEELELVQPDYDRDYTIIAIGGNPMKGVFKTRYIRSFKNIYALFDNDAAGKEFLKMLNDEAADINVYEVLYDKDFKDPDLYIKTVDIMDRKNVLELIMDSKPIETDQVVIYKKGGKMSTGRTWVARNRNYEMVFSIDSYNHKNNQLIGALEVLVNGKLVVKNSGNLDKMRVDAFYNRGKLELSQHLDKYYNYAPWDSDKPKRDFKELADVVMLSKNYEVVIKQLAWYLHNTGENLYNEKYKYLQRVINDEKTIAEILKEVNGFTNSEFDTNTIPLQITLSQFFHVTNNDAYFYFNRLVQDGSSVKLVPFLLSNKGEEIRLDLIKQKDPQCLLLIENKYVLPYAVETAPMNPEEVSLQSSWVDKWKANEIPKEDLDPSNLIKEIESFIEKFVYIEEDTKKVLSLWIFATYFHMLFKSGFPYLMFNGQKGTGKTTLDIIIYLLGLNAKMGLDFSSSSLFRMIDYEGGTFILDEVEHLSDKRMADSSDYAKILKGGYSDSSHIYRVNPENKSTVDRFSAFGPKVISNINGIDDVIADRCIFVRTFRVPTHLLEGLENINMYKTELRSFAYSIASRCALSALENFRKVHEIFNSPESSFETDNARLNQIIKPLFAMAELVGGDYKRHLISYYKREIEQTKKEVADQTLEGMVGNLLKRISDEILGHEEEKWATDSALHQYTRPIIIDEKSSTFALDTMHLKTLIEEMSGGMPVDIKLLHATVKNVLGPEFDFKKNRIQTTITIQDESLKRRMKDNSTIRGYRFFLNAKDWTDNVQQDLSDEIDDELF